ncbi:KAT8 regulatory NSL complex subunit 1-like, partial [Homarus americanus]
RERAFYRYCRARAWVASRWTWLQAQVADLEYRILQQQKIYTHVRNTKGAVQLEEGSRWRGMTLRDPAHLDVHDPALTCLAAPTARTAVNGYHSRVEDGVGGSVSDTSFVSARTQGLRAIKRRRLVRAGAGLCAGVRRGGGGGRIPAVQCKCVPPITCVLCTRLQGLVPPAAPPDPHTQPASERYARVDPTFHPVLSQPADVSLSERFDAMLKTTDWQRQILTAKTIQPLPVTRTNREASQTDKKKKKDKDRKKDFKKHKKETKGRITLITMKRVRVDDDDDASSVYGSSLHSSPSASPAPIDRSAHKRQSSTSNQKNKQSMSSNSYDIDNIVIPYSMAASTRVEKLEYKEIPTPKWRIVPLIPNNDEDISEETTTARHNRSEELERKKFLQYLHVHVTSRSSRSRRTDSSGTNTPDHPLSPRPPDPASDTISPLATPPTTPLAPSEDSNQSSSLPTIATIPNSSSSYPVSSIPSSSFTTLSSQTGMINSSSQLSILPTTSQTLPNQLLIHNPQLGSPVCTQIPTSTSISSSASLSTSASVSTLSSLLPGSRRNRTFSSSSSSRTRGFLNIEEGFAERLEGVVPYEQRVFPLNETEYIMMTRNMDDCDIGPPSPPLDSSAHETNNIQESGRSSPMSEVTDSAPEDDGRYDDTAAPKWTISGLKDATGQCVLQIHRN